MPSLMRTWQNQSNYEYVPRGSSGHRREVVETGASRLSATEELEGLKNRDCWDQLVDSVLIEMGRNPEAFADADEGIVAPTAAAVNAAVWFAYQARDRMLAAPEQTLPDGDGGVMIHRALPDGATESFEASADGSCSIWLYQRAPLKPVKIWSIDAVDAQL